MKRVERALLSVFDKTGLVPFAEQLAARGVEIVSTGGTASMLRDAGLKVRSVEELTGFPEMMNGRVKTLHPVVHGGLLARRDDPAHMEAAASHGIGLIDLVVVNLYPFEATVARPGVTLPEAIEQIDIGGPSMLRSAAKNHAAVGVITDPADYDVVIEALEDNDGVLPEVLRRRLAQRVFYETARYDAAIAGWLGGVVDEEAGEEAGTPRIYGSPIARTSGLRYGENPHQPAGLYCPPGEPTGLARAEQLQGKALSYNNWLDMDGAYAVARDLGPTGVVVVKHTNPCGAALSQTDLHDAYLRARACDPVSSFGGIVATMGVIDEALATELAETFLEVILAADVTPAAREVLERKKRLRVLTLDVLGWKHTEGEMIPRAISGGLLLQQADGALEDVRAARVVTEREPTEEEWQAMVFGWTVCRHVKSNAIVFSHADRTAAIGAGQMSRVDSSRLAVMKATGSLDGTAVASDAFFPFADGVEAAAEAGATAVVQPGGSIRDEEVIEAANRLGMTMVFTGHRHFRH